VLLPTVGTADAGESTAGVAAINTTTMPPRLLNEFLKKLFSLEIKIIDYFNLPFGTTLYAVVSKKHERIN